MPAVTDLDETRSLIQRRSLDELSQKMQPLSPREIVATIEALPIAEAALVFRLLDKDAAIAVFDVLDTKAQVDLVETLGHAELADVITTLDPDEQARLFDELPAKVAKRILASLDPQQLDAAMALLGYRPGSVGRHMSPEPLHASVDDTVGDVLRRVRAADGGVEGYAAIPVLTEGRVLVGIIDLLELLRHDSAESVTLFMDADPVSARTEDDVERIARRSLDHGDLLVPVVDRENRLVGSFPIADAALIDKYAVAEDHARAGASEPLRRPYLLTSVRRIAKARIVWLLVLAVSAVLTVQVLELFEATLSQQVVLALFIPLLIGIGGNTGSQAATTVTRALALGDVGMRDILRVASKEVRTGLLLGVVLAALAFAATSLFYDVGIGTVVGLTLLLNCPIAATVGGVIPLVARACRVDPAVFSTPFISTFCDASGLLVYFTVAIAVLHL
jgi:magnesium transporter